MPAIELTQETFGNFVTATINDDNFMLFQALLGLNNRDQQLTIFDALLNNVIDISDIASLKSFSKDEIDQFIQTRITYSQHAVAPLESPASLKSLNNLLHDFGYGQKVLDDEVMLKSKDRAFKLNTMHTVKRIYNPNLDALITECMTQANTKCGYTWASLWSTPTGAALKNWFAAMYAPILGTSDTNQILINIDQSTSILKRELQLSRFMFTYKTPAFIKQIVWPLANELNGNLLTAAFVRTKIQALLAFRFATDEVMLNPSFFVSQLVFWKELAAHSAINVSSEFPILTTATDFLVNNQVKQEKWLNYFYQEVRKRIVSSFPVGYENELPFTEV